MHVYNNRPYSNTFHITLHIYIFTFHNTLHILIIYICIYETCFKQNLEGYNK